MIQENLAQLRMALGRYLDFLAKTMLQLVISLSKIKFVFFLLLSFCLMLDVGTRFISLVCPI